MRIRRSIFWLCGVVVGLLVLIVWLTKRPTTAPPAKEESVAESALRTFAEAPGRSGPVPAHQPPHSNVAPPLTTAPGVVVSTPLPAKEEHARELLSTLNDVPINFYGKLQDQFGNPVAEAEIAGSIIFDNGSSNGVREVKSVSDANGLFALHGGSGESLSVIPRKEGYALASENAGFNYSYFYPETQHVPNPSQPLVVEMRKLQGAERLIHYQGKLYVPLNDAPMRLDLQTGKRVEAGGDIIIRVASSPLPNVAEKYDWKATIEAVNGGLVMASTEFEKMYAAPESRYEPEFVVGYPKDSQPWANGFTGAFYLKSRNGSSYGKLGLGINTDIVKNGAVFVMLNAYVNPAGSRNLELDPALVSEAKP